MLTSKFFNAWAKRTLLALTRADANGDGRIDPDELLALLRGELPGVDPTRLPEPDLVLDPDDQPIDALLPYVVRDFREAGKGKAFDRCREYDPKIYGYPVDKSRGQALGARGWLGIDTIVIHTAAAKLHADRWLGVPCHLAVDDRGGVVLCHDLRSYLAAAHKANSYSVSLEVSGTREILPEQVEPARAAVRYVVEELTQRRFEAGVDTPIKIIPHRHSHWSRVNDCDRGIWQAVGEWSIRELGCVLGDVVGTGKRIPDEWRSEAAA